MQLGLSLTNLDVFIDISTGAPGQLFPSRTIATRLFGGFNSCATGKRQIPRSLALSQQPPRLSGSCRYPGAPLCRCCSAGTAGGGGGGGEEGGVDGSEVLWRSGVCSWLSPVCLAASSVFSEGPGGGNGDRPASAMRTSRCSHLPGIPPECSPDGKSLPGGSGGPASSCPQYVMQVSSKDGQLLSSVVRTLAVQSSPFNDRPICRICHEGSGHEELLSPCECTGTLGTIHRSCLEHWLSSSNTSYCELCHFRFAVERKPRPLVEWLRNPGPQHEKRTLFGDMVCFLFITPLATVSGWLCLRGAVDHLHFSSRLEAVGLIALTVALFTIYLFWTLVSFRYHCRLYHEWRRNNQRVILLIPKSASVPPTQQSLLGLQPLKRSSKETIV